MQGLANRVRIDIATVKEGDLVCFYAHKLQERYMNQWWKVQSIEGVTLSLVDKDGHRARLACNSYSAIRIYRWTSHADIEQMGRGK